MKNVLQFLAWVWGYLTPWAILVLMALFVAYAVITVAEALKVRRRGY